MAFSGTNVANVGPPLNIATRPVPIAAAGPNGETEGRALVVAGDVTATLDTTGLATSAKQDTQITAEQAILAKLNASIAVTGTFFQATQPVSGTFWQATQPISAAALPLPSGASVAAKQPALGTAGTASADVISVQGVASMTPLLVNGSGVTQPVSGTVTANLGTIGAAATETSVAATATVAGTPSGAAVITDANGTIQQYLRGLIVKFLVLIGLFPASLGAKAAASSFAVTQSTEDAAQLGPVTETAPATDTASSGLNGRLQRIAQRLTSMIALLPASLGRKTAALSLAVVQAGAPYETVAASQTDQVLGGSGAAGDYLSHIVIQPVTTGAGAVTVKDGATTIFLFTSGTLADLSPKTVPFGIVSSGALSVTTGANVTVLAVGNFT